MKTYNNSSHVLYAVIQVRESDSGIERLVISYHDERILRQFLAKRSIVATGFSTRDEATLESCLVGIYNSLSTWSFIQGFRELRVCHQVRRLKTRMLSRLQNRFGAAQALRNVAHIGCRALDKMTLRFTRGRRGLKPAVQH
jgi:hypothetical protein